MKRFLALILCIYLFVIGMGYAGVMLVGEARLAVVALSLLLVVVALRYAATHREKFQSQAE